MLKSLQTVMAALLLAAFGATAATLSGTVRAASSGGRLGDPIADAKVVLMGFGGGGGGTQQRLDSTTTNTQGRYSFANVTVGFRQVVVSKSGYQNGQGFTNVTSNNGEFTVNVTMIPTGGGTGNTGAVAGTVRSGTAQGPPIQNALVVLARTGGGGGGRAYLDSVRTNAEGHFRFDSVPAVNNYTLRVSAAGHNPAANNNVDVNEGDTTTANFNLTPVPGPARPGSIAGTVRKSTDNAVIAGASVVLSRNGASIDSVATNVDGQYAFDSVAASTNYTLTVSAAGYRNAVDYDVDVIANTTSTVDFRLIPSGPSTTRGSIIGTVVDASQKAVAKARVILLRSGPLGGSGAIDTVETDTSGDFAFDSVAALQNYTLTVSANGYQSAVNNNVDVVAGQAVVADFILMTSTGILAGSSGSAFRLFQAREALAVEFPLSPWAGRLSAYDARGALAFTVTVPAGATRLSLPGKASVRFLVLERGGMVETLRAAPAH